MIIFDLDGTLADCEHRRHFIDPSKNPDYEYANFFKGESCNFPKWQNKSTGKLWKPDWHSFHEACNQDKPIIATCNIFHRLYRFHGSQNIHIWTGRLEKVRAKTEAWIDTFLEDHKRVNLRMRPDGDFTKDDELKERWLDEALAQGNRVDFVFEDRPRLVRMYRRRGIFVFNCCQHDEEF